MIAAMLTYLIIFIQFDGATVDPKNPGGAAYIIPSCTPVASDVGFNGRPLAY